MKRMCSLSLMLLLGLVLGSPLQGAGTQIWEVSDLETFLEGTFRGTGLTSEGVVLPTINTRSTPLRARLAWGSVDTGEGILIGTSLPATAQLLRSDHSPRVLRKTSGLGFTALARSGGDAYVAATPSGRVYRYDTDGDTLRTVTTLPDSYVWRLIPDEDNRGLYIGTGPGGSVYHMEPDGTLNELGSLQGNNVLALALYRGDLYAGDDAGGLYRRNDTGEFTSVYGFKQGELSALTAGDTFLYLAVNQRRASQREAKETQDASSLAQQLRQASMPKQNRRRVRSASDSPAPSLRPRDGAPAEQNQNGSAPVLEAIRKATQQKGAPMFKGLSGTLVYRMRPPDRMNVVYDDPEEIVHDLEAVGRSLFVATGGHGRLYKIREDFTRVAYHESPQKLLLDLRTDREGPVALTTGEGASLLERIPFSSERTTYRSPPMDSHLLSRWGHFEAFTRGTLHFRTRSGNLISLDGGWSEWSEWRTNPPFPIPSPPGRLLQFEARFPHPQARLKDVTIAYKLPNQRPRITQFTISSNPFHRRYHPPRSDKGNRSRRPSAKSTPEGELPSSPIRNRQVQWNVMDPDGDALETKLYYRPLDVDRWIPLNGGEPLQGQSFSWPVEEYADGRYLLKLVVSDRRANPPGNGFTAHRVQGPILVDNTDPRVESVELNSSTVSFRALDSTSLIIRARYRLNGGDWWELHPRDGILDESQEEFRFDLPPEASEGDLLEIQIRDEAGNRHQVSRSVP